MKLKKLTIHNIASIEDATIDFDAQPLADAEVFLITGKTGAGKSTILDAICLALFDKTPRLFSTKMQDNNDNMSETGIKDTRQLLRRNTGEAFVKLTFTANNGNEYEMEWNVQRAYKKPNGKLQSRKWSMKNINRDITLGNKTDIEQEINEAIGIDFNQFCRTTVLAQGEFTRFLNSQDKDKADILEKITGVSIYSELGAMIFKITREQEQNYLIAKGKIDNVQTLSDEEIAKRKMEINEIDENTKRIVEMDDKDKRKRNWLNIEKELNSKILVATEKLNVAQSITNSEDFIAKSKTANDWQATVEPRGWIDIIENANAATSRQKNVLQEMEESFKSIVSAFEFEKKRKVSIQNDIRIINDYFESEKERAAVYEEAQLISGYISRVVEGGEKVSKCKERQSIENKKLDSLLLPSLNKAKEAKEAAVGKTEQQQDRVGAIQKRIEEFGLAQARNKKDELKDLVNNINKAQEALKELDECRQKEEQEKNALKIRLDAVNDRKARLEQLLPQLKEAEDKKLAAKERFEKQKDTIHNFAVIMRQKLEIGDPCPVCGQILTKALPHEEALKKLVEGLMREYKVAEEVYNNIEAQKNKLEAELNSEQNAYKRDEKALEQDKTVEKAVKKLTLACEKCGIDDVDENVAQALNELMKINGKKIRELEVIISQGDRLQAELNEERKKLDGLNKEMENVRKEVEKANIDVVNCKNEIQKAYEIERDEIKTIEENLKNVNEKLEGHGQWKLDWKEAPLQFVEWLNSNANEYREKIQKKQKLTNELEIANNNCNEVEEVIEKIRNTVDGWKNVTAEYPMEKPRLLQFANQILTNATNAINQIEMAENEKLNKSVSLKQFLEENSHFNIERLKELMRFKADEINIINEKVKAIRDKELAAKAILDEAKIQLKEHLEHKPEVGEDDTIDKLNLNINQHEEQIKELNQRKWAVKIELDNDAKNKERLGKLIQEAEQKKTIYDKWEKMSKFIGDAKGDKFKKVAQSYVLNSLISTANHYMRTLSDRYVLKVVPGTFVISIEDAYQGYVSRAASTISGGESFLVSLALALALSDIGHRFEVDTLFIDEGFGTLSGEPLQAAINTLKTLQRKSGRHVGIISHVEELQEKIPVQIQVLQEGNSSSSTVNVITK